MPLYDRRLDAVLAAAELGSFSQAASRLHLSVPTLANQVETLERECGITIFERTHRGVTPTAAGQVLVESARLLVRQSAEALARARGRAGVDQNVVRLGVSMLAPARKTLDVWPLIHRADPDLKLELTPVESLYRKGDGAIWRLGQDVDAVQTSFSPELLAGGARALTVGRVSLGIDVVRDSPLAAKASLEVADLRGMRVWVLRHTCEEAEAFREELLRAGVEVLDADHYDLDVFNEIAASGDVALTSGVWQGIHPMMTTVPLAKERLARCVLLYAADPTPAVQRFVAAYEQVLSNDLTSASLGACQ